MQIIKRKIKGLFEVIPSPNKDNRGFFMRTYDEAIFKEAGLNTKWIQESISHTEKKHTVRGLHVSLPPSLEGKTITAIKGMVLWVVVDVRKDSPTFGQWDSIVLSEEKCNTLYAESGFAHGCISLTDNCDLFLRADNVYHHGTGILWNDNELNIDWKLGDEEPIISERDKVYDTFKEFKDKHGGV